MDTFTAFEYAVASTAAQAITPGTRAPRIGPARPVPAAQRLAAFLGRQP
jgi:hypothetical protein